MLQPANFATPSFDTSSPHQEALVDTLAASMPNVHEELLFHGNDIIMQRNDGTATCSILEEQFMMAAAMPNFICADNYWHGHGFTHAHNDNVDDECSLEFWEKLIQPTSHDASPSISPVYFSGESSGAVPTPFMQPSPVYSEASSVAAYQHHSCAPCINNHLHEHLNINACTHSNSTNCMCASFSPCFCETSGTCLANTDASFIPPSPGYSEVSSFAAAHQHDSFYMSNHDLGIHMGIHQNPTNAVPTSILPNFGHGNVRMTYSGSTTSNISTSDEDFFDNEASSFAAFASPKPYDLNLALAGARNFEVRASRPQLNSEARASPLHEASSYSMTTAGAIRNPDDCEPTTSGQSVSFVVETSTPAIEDGYVWRKYGQKCIKGRLHPRSYFKCAQTNCSVKKQTESSTDMQGFVLFTYFGRHNH